VVPVAAPDQTVNVDISLKGFTAGFDAVAKANAPKQN
jgi:invasion protein IalB